ncbi:unnamed protein product [Pieris macdunnoughi]|uniref:Uncharacterized protein n=1 Tax=Pieris macdunnoughi TaxID=345717 RepID=A0A821MB88_9NEOP|nr:unnamed protein product [Pieris macdunnoughi]
MGRRKMHFLSVKLGDSGTEIVREGSILYDGKTKNEIDYILTNLSSNVHNIQVLNITCPSDHRPVRAAFNILPKSKNRSKFGRCPKPQIKNKKEVQTYTEALNSCSAALLDHWNDKDTVQACYDKITNAIDIGLKRVQEQEVTQTQRQSKLYQHAPKH